MKPKQDLIPRLARAIGVPEAEVREVFDTWPGDQSWAAQQKHWFGPTHISYRGQPKRTSRAIFCEILVDLDSTHRVQRWCDQPTCLNPAHHQIVNQQGTYVPLPARTFVFDEATDIQEVIDSIHQVEIYDAKVLADLYPMYSEAEYERALTLI